MGDISCLLQRMAFRHTLIAMKRTTIWLTEGQLKQLARVSKKRGLAIAELIRRYVDRGLERER